MKLTFNRLSYIPAFALTLGLCGLAMPAMAQNQNPTQQPPPTSRTQTRSHTRHQTKSVTGCLEQGSNGNFVITAKDGTRYELEPGQGVKLASHVNHEVTVRGSVTPSSGMNGMTGSENSRTESQSQERQENQKKSGSMSGQQETMQVRSVKTVSNTCQQ